MSKTLLKCSRSMSLLFAFCVATATAYADFEFFESPLDFWNEQKPTPKVEERSQNKAPTKETAVKEEKQGDEGGLFPWEKYLDPKNKEFFKEGDHVPPEPFMELARNPTDYNLRMWFQYMDKKNELAERLQVKMKEYVDKNGAGLAVPAKQELLAKGTKLPIAAPDTRRFRFRMYFNSQCPHCQRMFQTLVELQSKGFYVEARQVDGDEHGISRLPFPVEKAAKNELREKDVQAVPLLLVGDLERKVVYRMQGYQSVESIFSHLSNEANRALPQPKAD